MLDRYLFGQLLRTHLALTLVLSSVVWLIQVLDLFDTAFTSGSSVLETMLLGLLVLPRVFTFTLAPALLIAVLSQLVRLLQDYEYFALTAAGLSPLRVLRPMLALAVLVTLIQGGLAFYLAPLSMKQLKLVSSDTASALAIASLQAGAFKDLKVGMTVYAGSKDDDGTWRNVMVYDHTSSQPVTYTARRATLSQSETATYFILSQGTQHFDDEGTERLLRFSEFALPLNDPENEPKKPIVFNRNHMTIHQLLYPAAYGVTHDKRITRMKARGLELISNLAAPIIFMLISFAVITAGGINRHGYGRRVMVAVSLVLLFQIGIIAMADKAVEASDPRLVFFWPVIFMFALIAIIIWQNDPQILHRLRRRWAI